MTDKILMKFAKKGINLSPEAYNLILEDENPTMLASSVIVKLKGRDYKPKDLISVSIDVINSIKEELGSNNIKKPVMNKIKIEREPVEKPLTKKEKVDVKKEEITLQLKEKKKIIEEAKQIKEVISEQKIANVSSETVEDVKIKYERNMNKIDAVYDYKVIQDSSKKSYTSGEIEDMIAYFQNRYEKLSNILKRRPELKVTQKINEIDDNADQSLNMILMVKSIRTTKNGHKLIEFEDDTGSLPVLFSNKNEELFDEAEKLIRDEVIGVIADKQAGKDNIAFGREIINPGVLRIKEKPMDFGIVFLSDIHIGSLNFLEEEFNKFINWINCDYGSEEQRKVAEDIKYLLIDGDIVDGIGVYPNQEHDLAIKDIRLQYDEAARFLGKIRSDVKIIIAPGNHDASRIAEPQPAIPEEYAKSLYELDNVEFVSNPAVISCDGINILMYHGESFLEFQQGSNKFDQLKNEGIMEEMLNKRHLAPVYGEKTPLASELEDYLVIDEIPDILHTGHVHVNRYKKYQGVHLINSGTWQTQTDFQKIKNIIPTPGQVGIIHKNKYKQFNFI